MHLMQAPDLCRPENTRNQCGSGNFEMKGMNNQVLC